MTGFEPFPLCSSIILSKIVPQNNGFDLYNSTFAFCFDFVFLNYE